MYILSDTRFKEQISSSAFMVRGHRSHRYASAFQNDRRLRLTTKGWNPLPFFPHHRSPPLHGRLRSSCIFSLPVPPFFPSFFLFCLFLPLFHRWLPAIFKHTAVKIGKNCSLAIDHYIIDLVLIRVQLRFEAIILGIVSFLEKIFYS